MIRTDIIKGKPIYIYKGKTYLYKPEKTKIVKMLYDDTNSITQVYVKKVRVWYEVICCILLVLCAITSQYFKNDSVVVDCNPYAIYYNGSLYLNLYNESNTTVQCTLTQKGEEIWVDEVEPGGEVILIPMSLSHDKLELTVSYTFLGKTFQESSIITVDNKDESMR